MDRARCGEVFYKYWSPKETTWVASREIRLSYAGSVDRLYFGICQWQPNDTVTGTSNGAALGWASPTKTLDFAGGSDSVNSFMPIVRLKEGVRVVSGDGSLENPYILSL